MIEDTQLAFLLGTTSTSMRQWSIKVSQYENTFNNLAPQVLPILNHFIANLPNTPNISFQGCTQYFYGSTSGIIKTYNFDQGAHLAAQRQKMCIRRESNQCRICYSIDDIADFQVNRFLT